MQDKHDITADEILSIYQKFGGEDYIGEPVSQLEHMSQCAQLALNEGYDDEVVLAAFFHDIGHMIEHLVPVKHMDGYGIVDHEKIGATYLLSKGFSDKIARLVGSHVNAKRYLTLQHPMYFSQLSEASKRTLEFQGGVMPAHEALAFEADEYFDLFIKLRRWDEAAKSENIPVIGFELVRGMMVEHLRAVERAGSGK